MERIIPRKTDTKQKLLVYIDNLNDLAEDMENEIKKWKRKYSEMDKKNYRLEKANRRLDEEKTILAAYEKKEFANSSIKIVKFEIISEKISNDGINAIVDVKFFLSGGISDTEEIPMIKTNNGWRLKMGI